MGFADWKIYSNWSPAIYFSSKMRHENGFLSIITQLKLLKVNKLPFQQESFIHSLTLIGNISTCD